jgi:hypothetical protein
MMFRVMMLRVMLRVVVGDGDCRGHVLFSGSDDRVPMEDIIIIGTGSGPYTEVVVFRRRRYDDMDMMEIGVVPIVVMLSRVVRVVVVTCSLVQVLVEYCYTSPLPGTDRCCCCCCCCC